MDRQIHCWIIIRQCPSYIITLWILSLIHIVFGKLCSLLCQPCSASELELISSDVFANVPKMSWRVELMLSLICVSPDKISTLRLHRKWEVNERLCIEEVGVDLEICVHAHRHDVDLIMEASLIIKWSLGISSSCICKLILCNRGPDRDCSSSISFLGQVKALVFCRSMHLRNLYFDLPSSITLRYIENIKELCRFLWVYI